MNIDLRKKKQEFTGKCGETITLNRVRYANAFGIFVTYYEIHSSVSSDIYIYSLDEYKDIKTMKRAIIQKLELLTNQRFRPSNSVTFDTKKFAIICSEGRLYADNLKKSSIEELKNSGFEVVEYVDDFCRAYSTEENAIFSPSSEYEIKSLYDPYSIFSLTSSQVDEMFKRYRSFN